MLVGSEETEVHLLDLPPWSSHVGLAFPLRIVASASFTLVIVSILLLLISNLCQWGSLPCVSFQGHWSQYMSLSGIASRGLECPTSLSQFECYPDLKIQSKSLLPGVSCNCTKPQQTGLSLSLQQFTIYGSKSFCKNCILLKISLTTT